MDKISVLGLLIGIVAIIGGQILEGGHVGSLAQPTALLIVLGGTMGAVMLQSPYTTFVRGMRMTRWVWMPRWTGGAHAWAMRSTTLPRLRPVST